MTNQNNAAQAADTTPFSDEYVNAVIQQHGYDSPECVIARLHQWIGLHGGENGVTLLMYEAHKALVKLRTPVADERAAVDPCGYVAVKVSAVDWLKKHFPALTIRAGLCERFAGRLYTITRLMSDHDAAPANAAVAGEAPPTDWQNALRIAEPPEVDEALAVFCNDGTLDNAVGLVQAILDAAPQVSDGVLPAPCHDLRYHDQYRIGWNRCLDACRAALSAQPGAQRTGGSDA